jgi:hypothetical protein
MERTSHQPPPLCCAQADNDFKWSDLVARNNSELLANLGNFINRWAAAPAARCPVLPCAASARGCGVGVKAFETHVA